MFADKLSYNHYFKTPDNGRKKAQNAQKREAPANGEHPAGCPSLAGTPAFRHCHLGPSACLFRLSSAPSAPLCGYVSNLRDDDRRFAGTVSLKRIDVVELYTHLRPDLLGEFLCNRRRAPGSQRILRNNVELYGTPVLL